MFTRMVHRGQESRRRSAATLRRLLAVAVLFAGAGTILATHATAGTPGLIITAQAGTGTAGAVTPGPATSSQLATPEGLAVDPSGDLFVADATDDQVLEVTPTGTLSVIAGTGSAGSAVPGRATASPLDGPAGVAVNAAGDVYIADTLNHEVEEVTPQGVLSIVAGTGTAGAPHAGPAVASPLGGPSGLALNGAGDLYVADGASVAGTPDVDRVTPQGTLSVIAGNGTRGLPVAGPATSSPLKAPTGIAVDTAGDVFIADATANAVVKVTPTGTLSLVAGISTGAAGAPTAGPATGSHLSDPTGLALDAAGDLLIADQANERLEQVTPGGTLSVLAGTGAAGAPHYGSPATSTTLDHPFAVAVTPAGIDDVSDALHATVERIAIGAPTATAAPQIPSVAKQGTTLTATTGTWTGSPTSTTAQWEQCDATGASCTPITGAVASTYTPAAADIGHTLRIAVSAANAGGATTATSAPTAVVLPLAPAPAAAPQIAGTTTDTGTLTASPGIWSNTPTAYAYRWQSCNDTGSNCAAIADASASSYMLQFSDVGNTVRVQVTATNAGGSTTQSSAPSAVIAPATAPWANVTPPAMTRPPAISGAGSVGSALTCAPGSWSDSPTGYTYHWNRNGHAIAGAAGPGYTATPADGGQTVTCEVTATNAGGAAVAVSPGLWIAATSAGPGAAGGAAGCPAPSGKLGAERLGPLALGETRVRARRALPSCSLTATHLDSFCLAGGGSLRAVYTTPRAVASTARVHRGAGDARIEAVLTDKAAYAIDGLHPGDRLGRFAVRHHLAAPLATVDGDWYVIHRRSDTGLLEMRHGVVALIGIARGHLHPGGEAEQRLLARLSD